MATVYDSHGTKPGTIICKGCGLIIGENELYLREWSKKDTKNYRFHEKCSQDNEEWETYYTFVKSTEYIKKQKITTTTKLVETMKKFSITIQEMTDAYNKAH